MERHRLHRNLTNGILLLGLSAKEIAEAFSLSMSHAKKIMEGRPVFLEQGQIDIIQSVLKNQLQYALSARVERLMNNEKTRKSFVAWVHSAALMMDIYDGMQPYANQCNFLNPMDPFLTGLYTVDAGMRETRELLRQIHQKCPQYDALFFHGTRLLETFQGVNSEKSRDRVPASIDIFALSPEDAKAREILRSNYEHH